MTFQDFIDRCFDTWSGFLLLDKILFIACIAMIVLSLVWEVADCYIVAQRKRAKAKRKRKYGSERARKGTRTRTALPRDDPGVEKLPRLVRAAARSRGDAAPR